MRPEDIRCSSCEKEILGRAVFLVPNQEATPEAESMFLHQTCYLEVFNHVFLQEGTSMFEVYIGSIFDLWAGVFTESDEEAGIE